MKRTAIVLFVLFSFFALPVIATAANENEAEITITYTKEAPSDPEPGPPAAQLTYTVDIPSTLSLNTRQSFSISANYSNLNDGQIIEVSIDGKSFAEDGYVYLTNNGPDKIAAVVNRWNPGYGYAELIYAGDCVARFGANVADVDAYGEVLVTALSSDVEAAGAGTYSATLYFNISVVGT